MNLAAWTVKCIKAHIAVHLDSSVDPAVIADAMQMRAEELQRVFANSFGCSLDDYVARRRADRALESLQDQQRSRQFTDAGAAESPR